MVNPVLRPDYLVNLHASIIQPGELADNKNALAQPLTRLTARANPPTGFAVCASGDNHLVHLVLLNKSPDRSVGFSELFVGFAGAYPAKLERNLPRASLLVHQVR